jgi:5'-nucleotidase
LKMLKSVHIAHTNDIHSHFESMPKVATVIRQLKEKWGESNLLVVDVGDHMDRMRVETEGTDGRGNMEVMNATGYEAMCIGNNEGLTFAPDTIRNTLKQAQFDIVTANMLDQNTGERPEWLQPFKIVEKNGLRIGLIGVTIHYQEFYRLLGWDVMDPIQTLQHWIPIVRPQVDILVVLSHLGLTMDEQLASKLSGVDLILGGHTHHLLEEPLRIGNSCLVGAGKFGQYVGHVEIVWDDRMNKIDHIKGEVLSTEGVHPDKEIEALIIRAKIDGENSLSVSVASLTDSLDIQWDSESPLGNLLSEGIREWVGAEIGLVNSGQLLQGFQVGEVTRKRLLEICPSPINPCRLQMSGDQIARTLEQSLLDDYKRKEIRGFGFRGKILGILCLSGIRVIYNSRLPDYEKIISIEVNGSPLERNRSYSVGTIDMFTFGIGYELFKQGTSKTFYLPEMLRDVLEKSLLDEKALRLSSEPRWIHEEKPFYYPSQRA